MQNASAGPLEYSIFSISNMLQDWTPSDSKQAKFARFHLMRKRTGMSTEFGINYHFHQGEAEREDVDKGVELDSVPKFQPPGSKEMIFMAVLWGIKNTPRVHFSVEKSPTESSNLNERRQRDDWLCFGCISGLDISLLQKNREKILEHFRDRIQNGDWLY
ncbi:hypothetical protein ASPWEDRAFT_68975 [Aspergillus wentii DTO 134E9]|uniref:Uncharacterized protein n=1 Tax=Aspergillus wentii DTO 134E9 TaxID=1073089 RepID=A0A1L9RL65_ASPWE|nr:uncharacterized protein ASPWEDRAFT_68975 [Aspergillus wentii DTO 134E9]OJJ35662.1 hypothetical protein ASPWEDRAFT_68975 [Aspergillus wentii DTO 134E9]